MPAPRGMASQQLRTFERCYLNLPISNQNQLICWKRYVQISTSIEWSLPYCYNMTNWQLTYILNRWLVTRATLVIFLYTSRTKILYQNYLLANCQVNNYFADYVYIYKYPFQSLEFVLSEFLGFHSQCCLTDHSVTRRISLLLDRGVIVARHPYTMLWYPYGET